MEEIKQSNSIIELLEDLNKKKEEIKIINKLINDSKDRIRKKT